MKWRTFAAAILAACVGVASISVASAQQVQAALGRDFAVVGEPVQLDISVTGGGGVRLPERINVPGLDIRFANKSEQMQMMLNNGRITSAVTGVYTYLVIPLKRGEFTIPPISVVAGGKTFKTSPLTLRVGTDHGGVPVLPAIPVPQSNPPAAQPQLANPSQPSAAQPPVATPPDGEVAFGDLIIPKTSAYVGEVVPIEIRFYFDANYPVQLQERPLFSGDGFTVMKLSDHTEAQQEINGRRFNVVSFKSAIVPAKAGTLDVPAATIESRIQFPSRRSQSRDDFFGGLLGNFGALDERNVTVSTRPVSLEVKALPADRPDSFTGAVGQFSLAATASPKKAAAGEPISLVATVAGRGNFDAMGEPALVDSDGWRTYDPGNTFTPTPGDKIGYSGEKQFDFKIVALKARQTTPAVEFTFFDPSLEKFVTVQSAPIAVEAAGGSAPAPTPAAAAPVATPQTAPVSAPPETGLATRYVPGTFSTLVTSRAFLVANGALAATWFGILLVGLGRKFSGSAIARESAHRRDARKILHQAEAASDAEAFYELAAGFIARRLSADHAGVRERVAEAKLRDETKDAIFRLLDACDEQRYSTQHATKLGAEEKRGVVAQLKSFDAELR